MKQNCHQKQTWSVIHIRKLKRFIFLNGEFTFTVEDLDEPRICKKGAFVSVSSNITHSFKNTRGRKGRIFGTMTAGAQGLESLLRNFGVKLSENDIVPDLNKLVEHLVEAITK